MKFISASAFIISLLAVLKSEIIFSLEDYIENNYGDFMEYIDGLKKFLPRNTQVQILSNFNDFQKKLEGDGKGERTYEEKSIKLFTLYLKLFNENKDKIKDKNHKTRYEILLKDLYDALKKRIDERGDLTEDQKKDLKNELDKAYGNSINDNSTTDNEKKPWYKNWKIILSIILVIVAVILLAIFFILRRKNNNLE